MEQSGSFRCKCCSEIWYLPARNGTAQSAKAQRCEDRNTLISEVPFKMLASITSVSSIYALPKALQQLSDTNMFLKPCTSLLLTTLMMQVHKRSQFSKPFMVLPVLETQQNTTFAKEEKVKQVGKRPFGRFC